MTIAEMVVGLYDPASSMEFSELANPLHLALTLGKRYPEFASHLLNTVPGGAQVLADSIVDSLHQIWQEEL